MSRVPSGTPLPNPLHLAPEAGAVGVARAWVSDVLADWPPEGVETARLLVSELVTNAVLHARTPIALSYRAEGSRARFDVCDQLRAGPTPKRYAADSPTGRGMRLVASLAEEWGVERGRSEHGGKAVWFIVSRTARVELKSRREGGGLLSERQLARTRTGGRETDASPLPVTDERDAAFDPARREPERLGEDPGSETVHVQVLQLPIEVYLEAEQHNDAVVRELTLIVQSARDECPPEVPRRLLELADEVRTAFARASDRLRAQVEDALRSGSETVDIHMAVPRHGWEALLRLAEWLDEVDRYCAEGMLLTLASSPRLRRFRAWYAQQVADQMRGLPPTPWQPGPWLTT
jgi:anti-sigma regulatory factor (Ser/Thr protein kinase)